MGRHSADGPSAASGGPPNRGDPSSDLSSDRSSDYETGEQVIVPPSQNPGMRRRVAVAVGVAMLGVILLVFGLISLLSTDDPPTASSQTSSSAAETVATTQPTVVTTTAATSTRPPVPAFLPVTVLNNSPDLEAGLATRVAAALEAGGWPIADLANYDRTQVEATTAFFTPGNAAEQAAAQALSVQFPEISGGAVPRFDGLDGAGLTVVAVGDWDP